MSDSKKNVSQETSIENTIKEINDSLDWVSINHKHRLQQKKDCFIEHNPIAWFLDEFPFSEIYYKPTEDRRSTKQEFWYHWLRQKTGWAALARLKSKGKIFFAASATLIGVILPIIPSNIVNNTAIFIWLLLGGILYLTAITFYELFSPFLLKFILSMERPKYLGGQGRRSLQVMVENELCRWWQKIEWTPDPKQLFSINKNQIENETILAMMSGYGTPAFCGFNYYACAHIEKAIEEFSILCKIKIWRQDGQSNQLSEFSVSYALGGYVPYRYRLSIRKPNSIDIQDHQGVSPNDLIVGWYKNYVMLSHEAPTNKNIRIDTAAEGLLYLFDTDENAIAFAEIISLWQDTLYPLRRLILILLYGASFFALFVFFVREIIALANVLF